jgi:hypothetical protein
MLSRAVTSAVETVGSMVEGRGVAVLTVGVVAGLSLVVEVDLHGRGPWRSVTGEGRMPT